MRCPFLWRTVPLPIARPLYWTRAFRRPIRLFPDETLEAATSIAFKEEKKC
jgi:hypothetical protein